MRPPPPPKLLSDGGAPSETEEGTAKRKRGKDTYYDKSEDFEKLAAKDELTLMLRQLHPKTGEFDVFKLFSKAGKVTDVRLITDERTEVSRRGAWRSASREGRGRGGAGGPGRAAL